jgi:hypothetical protein
VVHPYAVAGFLAAVFPLIATPGASLALLIQRVSDGGRRQALPVILGTATGLYIHAALAIAGLSAVVMHSSQAFTAVKLVGAAYLIGLGLWNWRSATPEPTPAQACRLRLCPSTVRQRPQPEGRVHLSDPDPPVPRAPRVPYRADPHAGHHPRAPDRPLAPGLDPPYPPDRRRPAHPPASDAPPPGSRRSYSSALASGPPHRNADDPSRVSVRDRLATITSRAEGPCPTESEDGSSSWAHLRSGPEEEHDGANHRARRSRPTRAEGRRRRLPRARGGSRAGARMRCPPGVSRRCRPPPVA